MFERLKRSTWLLTCLLLAPCFSALGQTSLNGTIPDSSLVVGDDQLLTLTLPPLEIFLERADQSPTTLRAKAYQEEQEHRLNVTRKEWLNNDMFSPKY